MKKAQSEPLVIEMMHTETYPLPKHSHIYYELINILKGSGQHHQNQLIMPYKSGDLFLISPEDEHYFEVKYCSSFCLIKFNDGHFSANKHLSPDMPVNTSPTEIMRNPLLKELKLVFTEPCKTILRKTVENLTAYLCVHDVSNSPVVFFQILSILGLIKEPSALLGVRLKGKDLVKENLLSYIHQYIYEPERIRVQHIASHFNIAGNYFSACFKRNFEISYRDHVNGNKLKLIEKRIDPGQVMMKQIAYEFGFTGESHLTNYFRKLRNISPTDYKLKNVG